MRPSSPSKMPAAMIENTAAWKLPPIAKRIAVMPAHSASNVRTFGTIRLTDKPDSRGIRFRDRRVLAERILKVLLPSSDRGFIGLSASLGYPLARRLLGEPVGQDGFAADHALPRHDHRDIRRRAINVDPRAEADDADPLAARNLLPVIEIADDAPRDEPGDQHKGDVGAFRRRDANRQRSLSSLALSRLALTKRPLV